MKVATYLLFALLLGVTSCSIEPQSQYDLIIENVNLIDVQGMSLQEGVNIYIKQDKIFAIDRKAITQKNNVIDGTDKYLIPGLFDCHAHTSTYKKDFPKFIHYGITSIFVPGGSSCTNAYYEEMRNMGAQDSLPAPRIFHTSQHFTMDGRHPVKTYSSSNWVEGESVYLLRDTLQIEALVKQVAQYPIQGIKLTIEDGPHPPFVERMPQAFINKVSKEARKYDLGVFAHISDNIELKMAIEADIKNLVHFTGVDLDFERDEKLLDKIYRDSISWVTTLMLDKSFIYPLHPEWLEGPEIKDIYDSIELEKLKDSSYLFRSENYIQFMKEYLQLDSLTLKDVVQFQVEDIMELYENGVNMTLGTDTGNDFIFPGYSIHEEMQLLELGGMKPIDILKMGTINAAKMLKADDRLGSIEVGKYADMILLDKNPLAAIKNTSAINTIIKNGKIQKRLR